MGRPQDTLVARAVNVALVSAGLDCPGRVGLAGKIWGFP
jgi:hypothetical protein